MSEDEKQGYMGWVITALIFGALVALLFIYGCADKKTTQYIREILPVIEHPACPPHQCWQGDRCGKCEDGEP